MPALLINGGGMEIREDAQLDCMNAIAFTLEGDPNEHDEYIRAIVLDVSVIPPHDLPALADVMT